MKGGILLFILMTAFCCGLVVWDSALFGAVLFCWLGGIAGMIVAWFTEKDKKRRKNER